MENLVNLLKKLDDKKNELRLATELFCNQSNSDNYLKVNKCMMEIQEVSKVIPITYLEVRLQHSKQEVSEYISIHR